MEISTFFFINVHFFLILLAGLSWAFDSFNVRISATLLHFYIFRSLQSELQYSKNIHFFTEAATK